ncbi:Yip1 family protein [Halosimplex salinum]|uniref:Yip1 family protein n=1 Tax=Halosimplex salinum TaxID=1710538 RepID=UPI000F493802|nr:Yip1 family protein [Halosimplex salinum]
MFAALRALLFDPDSYFERRASALDGVRGFVVAAVVAVLLTVVVGAALFGLSEQMTGTTTIDNPDRPPEVFCEDGGAMPSTNGSGPDATDRCDLPAEVDRDVGELFWQAASGQLPLLFVGVGIVWFGVGIALYVAAKLANGRGSFSETLAVTAYGTVPSLLTAVAGAGLLVWFAANADLGTGDTERLAAQFRQLTVGVSGLALTGVQLVGVVWQVYVWTYGLVHAHDLPARAAGAAAGSVGALLALGVLL